MGEKWGKATRDFLGQPRTLGFRRVELLRCEGQRGVLQFFGALPTLEAAKLGAPSSWSIAFRMPTNQEVVGSIPAVRTVRINGLALTRANPFGFVGRQRETDG